MIDIKNTENLLSQVHTITESYKRVSEATGDNFNIFSVLGIEHYEESTHSLFLTELLNPKGSHNFNDEFLKLFIKEINLERDFKTENAKVYVEYFVGNIDNNSKNGGRIDILIEDENKNRIIIENKIYAGEQPNQLERYYNFDNKATILFLTLFGENSQNHKEFDKYNPISYENNIIDWLEKCQQKAVENPVVRETLKQYKNLVKKLTNQNINSKMETELHKLVFENNCNVESAKNIKYILDNARNHLVSLLDNLVVHFQKETLKYQTYGNLKEIRVIPKFPYYNFVVIRLDLVFKNNDEIIYQLQLERNCFDIETIFWGKGIYFDNFNSSLMNLKLSNLIINSSSKLETVIGSIETNLTEILNFTAKHT